ncbi:MAG: glycosyltransferase [Microbacterium sp.]|nr:glycosyltransferase [Microbacterium sp.]
MRIAMVTDYYLPTLGGVQTVIKAHKEALEDAGHEVLVFAPLSAPSTDPTIVRLPTARGFAPDGYPFTWSPAAAAAALEAALRTRDVDVVHVHTEMFAALAGFHAARALGIPVVQTMHGRIDVYTRSVLPLPSVTTALLAGMHRRRLSHDRARIDASEPYARTRQARRMWRLMVSQANHAAQVIVPSAHFARKLVAQGVDTPVTVLSNGLEASVLDAVGAPAVRSRETGAPLRVVWCGRLSPEKRPEVFVDAAALVDGIECDMYGDGVSRSSVSRRIASLPPGRVRVHGAVPQAEVLAAMRRAHVLVSSSYDFDNQPMVILEAVATGLPVILADPDLAETVPVGGHLVAGSPDAAGLAAALTSVRDDPPLLGRMSAAAVAHRTATAQTTHRDALLDVYRAAMSRAVDR